MRQRFLNRLSDERGYVMIAAVILTTLMVSIGLVAAALIDNGTGLTRQDRERESALNVDEGVLYAQSLVMQTAWPSSPTVDPSGREQYYPVKCTSAATVVDFRCP